jgi:hypothetical protein
VEGAKTLLRKKGFKIFRGQDVDGKSSLSILHFQLFYRRFNMVDSIGRPN